jgi:hypothetical protein
MEQNVGGYDRIVRLVVGPLLLLVGLGILAEMLPLSFPLGILALLVGVVFIVTGMTKMCVLNSLLGVDTSER